MRPPRRADGSPVRPTESTARSRKHKQMVRAGGWLNSSRPAAESYPHATCLPGVGGSRIRMPPEPGCNVLSLQDVAGWSDPNRAQRAGRRLNYST